MGFAGSKYNKTPWQSTKKRSFLIRLSEPCMEPHHNCRICDKIANCKIKTHCCNNEDCRKCGGCGWHHPNGRI